MMPDGPEAREDVTGLDPWGLRRIERLLSALEGVDAIKLVPDGAGGIFWNEVLGPGPVPGELASWDMAFELTTIPEPATLPLLGSGLMIGALLLWRRKRC